MENLLFAPRAVADDTSHMRLVLEQSDTWGHARTSLNDEQFKRLVAEFRAPADGRPAPNEPLGRLPAWPSLYLYQMSEEWLPKEIFTRYGDTFDGALTSGSLLPAYKFEMIKNRLVRLEFKVEWDDDLEDLFDLNSGC